LFLAFSQPISHTCPSLRAGSLMSRPFTSINRRSVQKQTTGVAEKDQADDEKIDTTDSKSA